MNKVVRNFGVTLLSILSTTTYAKTYKYDLTAIGSHSGSLQYPNLDFNQAKSALFTVNKDPLSPDFQINSLEVTFPNAAKLTATGFKKIEQDLYRAVVNDVWIYRQVFVDVRGVDFNRTQWSAPHISVSISEKSVFINPESTSDYAGEPLFHVHGIIRDVTPAKIADTAVATVDGKRVTLSLKDNMSTAPAESQINGAREGFVIDALWQGKGQKTMYIPGPGPEEEFDRFTAIGLVLEELTGPEGKEYSFSVKYVDASGAEIQTPPQPLRPRLDDAFGTRPW